MSRIPQNSFEVDVQDRIATVSFEVVNDEDQTLHPTPDIRIDGESIGGWPITYQIAPDDSESISVDITFSESINQIPATEICVGLISGLDFEEVRCTTVGSGDGGGFDVSTRDIAVIGGLGIATVLAARGRD